MKFIGSLHTRLLLAFIGLAFVPILLVGAVLMLKFFTLQMAEIQNRQQDQLARVVVESENFFHNVESRLQDINRLQRVMRMPAVDQRNLLKLLLADWHDFEELTLLDQQGHEVLLLSDVTAVLPGASGKHDNHDDFRVTSQTLNSYASPVRLEKESGEPLMELSVPFIDPVSGTLEGVLVATIRVRRLWQVAGSVTLAPGQVVYAVDGSGHVIAHPDPSVVLRQTLAPANLTAVKRPGLSDPMVFAAHRVFRFGQQDFTIVTEYSRDAALVPTYQAMAIVLLALLVTLVLTAILFLYLRHVIINPIENIARVAQAIESGKTDERVTVGGDDEIGRLALAFNAMTGRLLASANELSVALGRLRLYRDQTLMGHIEWDLEFRVIEWNPAAERIFGYTRAEAMGRAAADLVLPEAVRPLVAAIWQALLQRRGGVYQVNENISRDGRTLVCEWNNTPLTDADGRVTSVISLVQDITERRRAELELENHRHHLETLVAERTVALSIAKELAETASRAKSTFLANMSHELRTPMNAIMGMTSLALRKAADPKLRDQLGKIEQASQRLLGVINDILDISKIEAERLTLEQVTFKLGGVLENLMSLIGQKATEKKLKLRVHLPPEVARQSLLGDPLRLGQILLNLAGNAIKFTEQGAITLHAHLVEDSPTAVLLRFEVQDTGIGIAPENQKRLFTAFEQADGSMTRKYGGTGLGLAISKRLANLMGGEIGVESVEGEGSTFWFTVRMGKADDAVPLPPTFSAESTEARLQTLYAGSRILLAEDEPVNQEVSRGLLEDVGFTVDLAADGAAAVEMARNKHYDLIVMDMQMPRMNGVDATRAIRALPGYVRTPILAMTANAFDEDRQVCIEAGMNDHIGKPVNPERLYETLLKWLAQEKTPAHAGQARQDAN